MTLSETLFEQLCSTHQIRFEPIPTVDGQRTADYRIWLGTLETIVEVKQIDSSEQEKKLLATGEDENIPAVISIISKRIRNKFDDAKRQLKNLSCGRLPALLVLYDNTNGLSGMDNESIMNAMHGDEVVEVERLRGSNKQGILRIFDTFGKKNRKIGRHHNRSVSAIGRLLINNAGKPMLFLFHNEYATNPLSNGLAKLIAVRQFIRPASVSNEYRHWMEVTVN
jgi:hypothetical protein